MGSSRRFAGTLIPSSNTPYPSTAPFYILSGTGANFTWESVAPSSGGVLQLAVLNASKPANTLISVTSDTNNFDLTTGVFTPSTVNGTQWIGQVGRFTSTGTLPTGIAGGSNYYCIPIKNGGTPTQYQFVTANIYANYALQAYQGVQIPPMSGFGLLIPSDNGTVGATLTWTPILLNTATVTLQQSNSFGYGPKPYLNTFNVGENININNINTLSPSNFVSVPTGQLYSTSNPLTITAEGSYSIPFRAGCAKWMRASFTCNSTMQLICSGVG